MRKNENMLENTRIDYGIILSIFILFVVSMISLYATSVIINGSSLQPVFMHLVWYVFGALCIVVIMQIDSKLLWKLVPLGYGAALILLVAVLFLYDKTTAANFGARSWFVIGPLSFQPSEFSKIALILMLARLVTMHNLMYRKKKNLTTDLQLLLKIAAFSIPVLILVILENDLGTTLVLLAIVCGVVLMSGISAKILVPLFAFMMLFSGLILYLAIYHREFLEMLGVKSYQFTRIDAWLKPFDSTTDGSYQVSNAILAIATGGMFGKGIGVSNLHVPVRESDMIFSTIGENTGFIGTFFVILVYFTLIYQMIKTCFDTKNEFYTYICVGVISMITFHIFENVGMNVGLLPLTGIPLPFISQGGSALSVNMIGVGLILAMRYQSQSYQKMHYIK
ncbi:FtsW/RodA/SpoVE family cell cycle protein [Granulicatella sp. 19428wC4_WM01]|uniref:FtsW/RodA/SpoVE family cell cycle protein n=1 Tax=unclassified Granulicatella TaxID=2630493 RepID=UPI00351C976B